MRLIKLITSILLVLFPKSPQATRTGFYAISQGVCTTMHDHAETAAFELPPSLRASAMVYDQDGYCVCR